MNKVRTLYLTRRQWQALKEYYSDLTDDIWDFKNGDHIDIWKSAIEQEFKAKYSEATRATSNLYYGKLVFKKTCYITWFNLKMAEVKVDFDED